MASTLGQASANWALDNFYDSLVVKRGFGEAKRMDENYYKICWPVPDRPVSWLAA